MNMHSSRFLALAAVFAFTASALPAQGLQDAAVVTQPTFTSLKFGEGVGSRTVSQFALPIAVILPFGERFTVDVTTAFASSSAKVEGGSESSIAGLTDTQIRGNYRFASDQILLTFGINLPTGQYEVALDQQEAAGQIGNDFLYYPISSMGNGFAATGGVALARPVGAWNVGVGGSVRKSTEFTAFADTGTSETRFTPADEYRLQLSADRPVSDGQVSFGLTYSAFGDDLAANTTYSTGDRIIGTAGWNFPFKGTNVFLSSWNLYRLAGQQLGGDAPPENVFNVSGAVSFDVGKYVVQPSVETRLWQVDGARAGNQFNLGARVRVPVGSLVFYPQAGYTMGNVYQLSDGAATKVSGLRLNMTVRYN
jgi:hypothetical protein